MCILCTNLDEDGAAEEFFGSCWEYDQGSQWMDNEYTRNALVEGVIVGTAHNDGGATVITCS